MKFRKLIFISMLVSVFSRVNAYMEHIKLFEDACQGLLDAVRYNKPIEYFDGVYKSIASIKAADNRLSESCLDLNDVYQLNDKYAVVASSVGGWELIYGNKPDIKGVNPGDRITLLLAAVSIDQPNPLMVSYLLSKGADPNFVGKYNETALDKVYKYVSQREQEKSKKCDIHLKNQGAFNSCAKKYDEIIGIYNKLIKILKKAGAKHAKDLANTDKTEL